MGKQVTIRDIPEDVRNTLAARAAAHGQSMQEYLRGEIVQLAAKPTSRELLARIRAQKAKSGVNVPIEDILAARDAGRD